MRFRASSKASFDRFDRQQQTLQQTQTSKGKEEEGKRTLEEKDAA